MAPKLLKPRVFSPEQAIEGIREILERKTEGSLGIVGINKKAEPAPTTTEITAIEKLIRIQWLLSAHLEEAVRLAISHEANNRGHLARLAPIDPTEFCGEDTPA
jgi:hypothetical protein